jgi:hypothetical protein
MHGGKYTWSNKHASPTLEKLDRILMSPDWEDLFSLVTVRKLVRELSDHNALLLDSGNMPAITANSREFRFDVSWFKNQEFLPSIEDIWNRFVSSTDPIDILNIKLKRFKKFFKGWGSNLYGHAKKLKLELREELASLESIEEDHELPPSLSIRKTNICVQLMEIYADEERLWYQKTHEKWLLQGDLNTSYFHRVANGRKRKNTIFSLKKYGINIEGTHKIIEHATSFYKSLFGPAPGNVFHFDHGIWEPHEKLDAADNEILSRPFSIKEVKDAIFSMAKNKAPGPDNIPIEFYQHCWDIVKFDIMNLFTAFHAGTLDVQRLNYGIITLLPKISDADKISQYRPICLLRSIYKLLTKVLTIRVEPFLDKIISVHQNAFMKRRNIVDGIMSLHELMHHTHVKETHWCYPEVGLRESLRQGKLGLPH